MRLPLERIPPVDERELHERALQKDPVILGDLLLTFTEQMTGFVRHDLKCDEDMARDAVIDILFAYVQMPGHYHPDKGRLVSYLTKAAKNRVKDRRKSRTAEFEREKKYARDVELQQTSPKEILENFVEASRVMDRLIGQNYFKDEKDKAAMRLILMGEGSTEVLARALGLDHLSGEELKREVKRHRDRLMKILARFGKEDPDDPA